MDVEIPPADDTVDVARAPGKRPADGALDDTDVDVSVIGGEVQVALSGGDVEDMGSDIVVLLVDGTSEQAHEGQAAHNRGMDGEDRPADGGTEAADERTDESTGSDDSEDHPKPRPPSQVCEERPVTYSFLEGGSKRGKTKLFDSLGFSYVFKTKYADQSILWRCPLRNKEVKYCPATVKQEGDSFQQGPKRHVHEAPRGAEVLARVFRGVKDAAVRSKKCKTSALVREVLCETLPGGDLNTCPDLPSWQQLCHLTRKYRRKNGPQDPEDINSELLVEHIPGDFLVDDIKVDAKGRHLLFATEGQLELLADADCWYVDTTSKIVPSPFLQLFSIHALVQSGDEKSDGMRQVPLAFAFMTTVRKRDYKAVLRSLRTVLHREPQVKSIVLNFEDALWRAFSSRFPEATLHGCMHSWRKKVLQKIKDLGLEEALTNKNVTQTYIRRLMALPILPARAIRPMFGVLRTEVKSESLLGLCAYMEEVWLPHGLWGPESWSAYKKMVCMNNRIQGWHSEISQRFGSKPPFYGLVGALFREAGAITQRQVSLASEESLRHSQKRSGSVSAKLWRYWAEYDNGSRSTDGLLQAAARLFDVT